MSEIVRNAGAHWEGDLKSGKGNISTQSTALFEKPYDFGTRFGEDEGTNPEELIAAAHAACFSMALAGALKSDGYTPEVINTSAECTITPQNGGFKITKMHLLVHGKVPDIDEPMFKEMVIKADKECPVSNLLRCGLEITFESRLN